MRDLAATAFQARILLLLFAEVTPKGGFLLSPRQDAWGPLPKGAALSLLTGLEAAQRDLGGVLVGALGLGQVYVGGERMTF